jgi:hypothetical protein
MKFFKNFTLSLFALSLLAIASCTKTTDPEPTVKDPFAGLTLIGETEAVGSGAIVKIYAEDELFVGYNRIHVAVYDSANHNTQLTDAHVTFMPMMDMGMMKHSCPVENPSTVVESGTNTFKGAVVFIMPTTATGSWDLGIHIHNHANNQEGMATLPITVVEKEEPRLISFISDYDSAKVFVTRIDPVNPEIGLNDIVFGVYKKETMMSFPAIDGYLMEMEPEMPSMNHGSPNNVNPVSMGNGMYKGVVNFTMTGYWKINLDIKTATGDNVKLDQFFDVTFQ